jgi:D-3-phosphoglycerate dehydrogenase
VKKKIFVALSTFAEHGSSPLELLERSGFDFSVNTLGKRLIREEIVELGKDAEGIVAGVEPYDDFVIDRLPRLRCISRCGVGIDNIDSKKASEKKIIIKNTPDVVIQPVVELTVAMTFDLMRKLSYHTGLLRAKRWHKEAGNLLFGKTVGVLGLGRIGKKVAEVMRTLGTEVYGADLRPDRTWADHAGVKIVSLAELLRISDILTIHLSSIKEKPFQLGADEIAAMKAGAFLINVSRGQMVDETALYDALKNGRLAGAALDVFPNEPYIGKLCELDNIVMTPHIATLTKESRVQMEEEAVRNAIDCLQTLRTEA